MPKFVLPLKSISASDSDEIGQRFSSFANFPSVGTNILPGALTTFAAFQETFSAHFQELSNLIKPVKSSKYEAEFFTSLQNLLLTKVTLSNELLKELESVVPSFPVKVASVVKLPSQEMEFDLGVITTKQQLSNITLRGFLSFLNKDVLKKIDSNTPLESINVSLLFTKKLPIQISGQVYISNPKKDEIKITACFGEGNISVDQVTISSQTLTVKDYSTSPQTNQTIWSDGQPKTIPIAKAYQMERKLSEDQLHEISLAIKHLQAKLLSQLSASFEISAGKIYFTSLEKDQNASIPEGTALSTSLPVIATLKPIFPGIATGVIKHINRVADFPKIRAGQIAVVETLKKENIRFLKKASGVIISSSARFQKNHSYLINQLGIGVAIGDFNNYLEGVITLDGKTGKVYRGSFFPLVSKILEPRMKSTVENNPNLVTATKLFALAGSVAKFETINFDEFDGFGPIKFKLINEDINSKRVRSRLCEQLSSTIEKINDKQIIFQLDKSEAVLLNELEIVRNLRNNFNFKNISVSLPPVSTTEEFSQVKKLLSGAGLHRSPSFKVLTTVTVPSVIFSLEDFHEIGTDGFLIDYWELANNLYTKNLSQNELISLEDNSLEKTLEKLITFTTKNSLFSGVYNIPAQTQNKIAKKLVSFGVKAISVNSGFSDDWRKDIAKLEKEFVVGI